MGIKPGIRLGERYQLLAPIATGGMGQVWRAEDTTLHRVVAAKILRSEFTGDETFLERFRAEARNTASLSHPNIASVYDYGEQVHDTERLCYLVMELVEGNPLVDILARERRLSPARTLDYLEQTAMGLAAAHRENMVHRDIKPGNLIIRPDGVLKITDFGIARAANSVALTERGTVVGTAQYLAPEQAEGKPAWPASDIYALGVVGYECLAGFRPFDGDNSVAIALAQIREAPRPLPADVPPNVRALIEMTMRKNPNTRYEDGATFIPVVRAVRAGGPPPPPVVRGPQPPAPGPQNTGPQAPGAPGPGSPGPRSQVPGPQLPSPQVPRPQVPGAQVPSAQVPGTQVPGPQAPGPPMRGAPGRGPHGQPPQGPGPQGPGPQGPGPHGPGPQSPGPQGPGPQGSGPQGSGPQGSIGHRPGTMPPAPQGSAAQPSVGRPPAGPPPGSVPARPGTVPPPGSPPPAGRPAYPAAGPATTGQTTGGPLGAAVGTNGPDPSGPGTSGPGTTGPGTPGPGTSGPGTSGPSTSAPRSASAGSAGPPPQRLQEPGGTGAFRGPTDGTGDYPVQPARSGSFPPATGPATGTGSYATGSNQAPPGQPTGPGSERQKVAWFWIVLGALLVAAIVAVIVVLSIETGETDLTGSLLVTIENTELKEDLR